MCAHTHMKIIGQPVGMSSLCIMYILGTELRSSAPLPVNNLAGHKVSLSLLFLLLLLLILRQGLSVYLGCPRDYYVEQAGFDLMRASPASASQMLRLKSCITMPGQLLENTILFPTELSCHPY